MVIFRSVYFVFIFVALVYMRTHHATPPQRCNNKNHNAATTQTTTLQQHTPQRCNNTNHNAATTQTTTLQQHKPQRCNNTNHNAATTQTTTLQLTGNGIDAICANACCWLPLLFGCCGGCSAGVPFAGALAAGEAAGFQVSGASFAMDCTN